MPQPLEPTTDIDEVRGLLASMISDGRSEEAIALVIEMLETLLQKNSSLMLKLRKLRKEHYGRSSEKISTTQLSLLLGELAAAGDDGSDEAADDQLVDLELGPEGKKKKRKVTPHGRRKLPADLEREEHHLRVPDDQRKCERCGEEKTVIGHEASEVLEFVPAKFKVLRFLREKLACKSCGDGVTMAPVANKVIERGLPGPGLLAQVVVDKYVDHLPLNRQAKRYYRLGVDIPRSTLSDWNGAAADLLRPLWREMREQVLASYVLQADGTGLRVLDKNHSANVKKGSLWCFVGDAHLAYFAFSPNQSKEGPLSVLRERVGYIQADADPKLDGLFAQPDAEVSEVGCWMHARRRYVAALDGGDLRAAYPLKLIKGMYRVEREAKKQRAGPDEIKRMRQEQSMPLLLELGDWIAKTFNGERPTSPLADAMGYTVRQWEALKRYTEDGRLPIDNGACERAIRAVAVGRRNYLFAGSDAGGERAAIAYSLLGSCSLAGADPWAYLRDVFTKLVDGWLQTRIEELLPARWLEDHPEHRVLKATQTPEDEEAA